MYPRFLITVDEKLESMPVTVRVGQASLCLLFYFLAISYNLSIGARRRRPSGQAAHDLGLPDAPNTRAARNVRARGAGDGGVHSLWARPRGLCDPAEKSWVGEAG